MAVLVQEIMKSCSKKVRSSKNNNKKNNNKDNNQQQKMTRSALLDAVSQGGKNVTTYKAEDGSIRMKILVKKQDLDKILGAMNSVGVRDRPPRVSSPSLPSSTSSAIERRLLELMRKKKANAQAKGVDMMSSSWRPNLQSIPEEH